MKARSLLLLLLAVTVVRAATPFKTEHVVLMTADGIRHQELFGGADPALLDPENSKSAGIQSLDEIRAEFWADETKARREKLMPFFWRELVKEGVVFGNRQLGSAARVRNPHHFSYPGYAEILNGQPLEEVTSNDKFFSPRQTILEYVQQELNLPPGGAAAFGSWNVFNWIVMQKEDAVVANAGYEHLPKPDLTPRTKIFDDAQFSMRTPWDSVRHDTVTLEFALEHLRAKKPRLLYLALGETDDWAHDRRYDQTLRSAKLFDDAVRQVWQTLQSMEQYRGKTTLIITTDHGRGRTPSDWTSHGKNVPGADETWIAVFGPDTPKLGEARNVPETSASNVAATILTLFGLDYRKFNATAAPPLPAFVRALSAQ